MACAPSFDQFGAPVEVAGGVAPVFSPPLSVTFTADLSGGLDLDGTTAFGVDHKPAFVSVHLSAPLPGVVDQMVTVRMVSPFPAYSTIVKTALLAPGDQDVWIPFDNEIFPAGYEIEVIVTATGSPAVDANVTIVSYSG